MLALLGPNGAGKTTTVETLEGYRRPTAGRVRVLGLDPIADRRALAPSIGVMLQRGGVYPAMSPREALRLFAAYYDDAEDPDDPGGADGAPRRGARHRGGACREASSSGCRSPWLWWAGPGWRSSTSRRPAWTLPAGCAIREVVRELRDRGVAVLLTTHEMEEAERLADRVVIIDRGAVVAMGSPAELMTAGAGREIRFGAPPGLAVADLGASLGAAVTEEQPGEYRVDTAATPAAVAALTAWLAERDLPLADLRAGRQRLEDVFLRLTSRPCPRTGGDP